MEGKPALRHSGGYTSVLVLDLNTGKLIHTIGGIGKSHAVLYREDLDRIYVTDGDAGDVKIFDGKKVADIQFDGDTLEAMVLEKSGSKIYVNNKAKTQVDVVDREKREVIAAWPVTKSKPNVALGFDEANHRLFVACVTGRLTCSTPRTEELTTLPITKGVDDLVYDAASKRIYSAGDGSVDAYAQTDADNYKLLGKIPTGPLGKTARLVPDLQRYFVAVPQHGAKSAEILVFEVL